MSDKKESFKSRVIAESDYNEWMQLRQERSELLLRLGRLNVRLQQLDKKFRR